jgi:hypothetical protein
MTDGPELHDFSRLDAHMASLRRTALLHASWRPALAGAVGASLIIAAVWVAMPKFTVREVVVDRVVPRDVPFDNYTPRNIPFDNFVPHNAPGPVAANPPTPRSDAPKTPAEKKFTETPAYKRAIYRGRIIKSRDGLALSFAGGRDFWPYHWDDATGTSVPTPGRAIDSDPFVGLLGLCVPRREHPELWECRALKDGVEVPILDKPASDSDRNPPPARIRTASEAQP